MPKPEEALYVVGTKTESWKQKFDEIIAQKKETNPDVHCDHWEHCFPFTFMAPCCGYFEITKFSDMPKFGENLTCKCGKHFLIYFEK